MGKPVVAPATDGAAVANESEALRRLQDTWNKAGQEDRAAFLRWLAETSNVIVIP